MVLDGSQGLHCTFWRRSVRGRIYGIEEQARNGCRDRQTWDCRGAVGWDCTAVNDDDEVGQGTRSMLRDP